MTANGKRSLASLGCGDAAVVIEIAPSLAGELGREGIRPGSTMSVLARAPLGGALVVGLGRARIAVARPVAAGVLVRPDSRAPDR
jgi:Fe2+ transport system protein FeoA